MRREHKRIEDAGASATLVVMGSPMAAGRFREDRDLPFAVMADPDRTAYRAFGLATAGPSRWLVNRNVAAGSLRLFRRGIASGLPHPGQDIRQMPGAFVISASGVVRFAHYSVDSADLAPIESVLSALGA